MVATDTSRRVPVCEAAHAKPSAFCRPSYLDTSRGVCRSYTRHVADIKLKSAPSLVAVGGSKALGHAVHSTEVLSLSLRGSTRTQQPQSLDEAWFSQFHTAGHRTPEQQAEKSADWLKVLRGLDITTLQDLERLDARRWEVVRRRGLPMRILKDMRALVRKKAGGQCGVRWRSLPSMRAAREAAGVCFLRFNRSLFVAGGTAGDSCGDQSTSGGFAPMRSVRARSLSPRGETSALA